MFHVVVNKHRVRANQNLEARYPVFRCSKGKFGKPFYRSQVSFPKGCSLKYDPENPMPCGASVWIEAEEIENA